MMFEGLKVGDEVVVLLHRGHDKRTVDKVGRKYLTIGGVEFYLADGRSKSGYTHPRAYTIEAYALVERMAEAEKALRDLDVTIGYRVKDRQALVLYLYEALKPRGLT